MTNQDVSLIGEGKSKSMSEREQFQRFKAYMDAPCHELDERDGGRNDPHRLAFAEWGVPQEFLLWMWQAAEQASRRAALEEAWSICNTNAAKLKGPKETASGYVACVLTADDIRALAKGDKA